MLRTMSRYAHLVAIFALGLAVSFAVVDIAEARRAGGGLGSRGTRTFQAPAPTRTAPNQAAPIERSMSPKPQTGAQTAAPQTNAARPGGLFGGFGRSMIGGLLFGGLIGALLGSGFGGMAGMLGMLLQIALIGGVIMLAMRFFARRQPQPAAASGPAAGNYAFDGNAKPSASASPSFRIPAIGSGSGTAPKAAPSAPLYASPASGPAAGSADELGLTPTDLDRFEELLGEVQTAYGAEDYATLRKLATPEAMSYLAEELGENATKGLRNSVSGVKLLQGDISESWREGDAEYATLAMCYESIDAMLDRDSGRVVEGDDQNPTENTEIWTFVRQNGGDWKLSAIQAA
ncbi:MAG: Tim44 domain-containing protein [Phyllobacterium sp.]